jgi:outer membrane protein OmpA-like peptidoglycan-associated protein
MKRTFAGFAAAMALFVTQLEASRPADACSVHLVLKTPNARQAVARSSRPSDILLLGSPSLHLKRDLTARGHNVEVAPSAATAKRPTYAAVMTDESHFEEAKIKYGPGKVFLYKNFTTDAERIEGAVARAPTSARKSRVAIVVKHNGVLVGAGGGPTDNSDQKGAPPPNNQDNNQDNNKASVAASITTHEESRALKPAVPSKLDGEMFFGLGSVNISRRTAITTAVSWLKADEGRTIVIAGFADPSGTHEANLALSQNRAEAVKDAIVSAGIDGSRIEVQAYGDTQLKYGRSDARNRRVSIKGK